MYKRPSLQMSLDDFILPFEGTLLKDNRWVKLAQIIPWSEIEKQYAELFSSTGNPAKPLRMALGALIIKEKCKFSDEETVQHITENHYLQYFIGLKKYQSQPPFDPSLMVFFRKRLTQDVISEINEMICQETKAKKTNDDGEPNDPPVGGSPKQQTKEASNDSDSQVKPTGNKGKLLLDATCAPADIRYPTDLSLLNKAREKLEKIMDVLHNPLVGKVKKARNYRQKGRKLYLLIAKQKRPRSNVIRKGIRQQLQLVARDLHIVQELQKRDDIGCLSTQQIRDLTTIKRLYEQQKTMYESKTHSIVDRIVSIHQPHVRPIVRGKARSFIEFGAKIAISLVNGYSFIEELSWDAFNESRGLELAVERYRERYGYYPEAILADQIYRNRENLKFCQKHNIRLSGPKLGRPTAKSKGQALKLERQDTRERNAVEGKFGEGKRCYGLSRIMARLKETASCVIAVQFLVMNLERKLRVLFVHFIETFIASFSTQNGMVHQA